MWRPWSIKALAFEAYERCEFEVVNRNVINEEQTESFEIIFTSVYWAKYVKEECSVFMYFDKIYGVWTQNLLINYPSGQSRYYRVRDTVASEQLVAFRDMYYDHVHSVF